MDTMPHSSNRKPVAVTGGSGYVGGYLIAHLLARGHAVTAVLRTGGSATPHLALLSTQHGDRLTTTRLPALAGEAHAPALAGAFAGSDAVYHVASPIGATARGTAADVCAAAADAAAAVVHAAARAGARRVVVTSSSATIYDVRGKHGVFSERDHAHGGAGARVEDMCAAGHLSTYAMSKIAAEARALDAGARAGVGVVCVNPGLVLGPPARGQTPRSSNALLLHLADGTLAAQGLRPDCLPGSHGYSTPSGIVHVDDVVHAHVAAAEADGLAGGRVLVNSRDQYTVEEVARCVVRHFPRLRVPVCYAKDVPEHVPRVGRKPSNDNAKVEALLGRPLLGIDRMVVDGVQAMLDQGFVIAPAE